MKTKYKANDLLDFLLQNPMEMREFIDEHNKLNFFQKLLTKIKAYFY
jgi:hypothetical protein